MPVNKIHPNKLKKIKNLAINIAALFQKEYTVQFSSPALAFLDLNQRGIFVDTLATKANKSYMVTDDILDKNPSLSKDLSKAKTIFSEIQKEVNLLSKVYNVPSNQIWNEVFAVLENNI
jgi:hypothetical protein